MERAMKNLSILGLATLVLVSTVSPKTIFSQTKSGKEPPKMVRVTGCLVRGDKPGEVWLAEKDGTIYGLEGSTIELNASLGHKVTLTGYVPPEKTQESDKETKKQSQGRKIENADLPVLKVRMIAVKCGQ